MKQVRVTIPYGPRRIFLPYHNRAQRWACLVAHRRAGKTVACINDLIKRAMTENKPDGRYAYIAPLLGQAKDVAWSYLQRYAAPIMAAPPSQAELYVTLHNKARIRLYGADNPDRLRGPYYDGVVLDEYADMFPSVWGEILRPALSDRRGWATFIGTPKGRNAFFKIFQDGEADPANWYTAQLKASETGILPQSELDDAKRDMTPEQYDQEFECSFEAAIIGAYFGREMADAERAGRLLDKIDPEPSLPIHTAWDLGRGDHMAIWVWQMVGREIRVIDFLQSAETEIYSMREYCIDLKQRGYVGGIDYVPHDATVHSLETGRTRVETLIAMGRKPRVLPRLAVEDGINAARLTFPRLYFDKERCKIGLEALRNYRADFDEKSRTFRDVPKQNWATHGADALRYLCMAWREAVGEDKPKTEQEREAEQRRVVAELTRPRTMAEALTDDGDE